MAGSRAMVGSPAAFQAGCRRHVGVHRDAAWARATRHGRALDTPHSDEQRLGRRLRSKREQREQQGAVIPARRRIRPLAHVTSLPRRSSMRAATCSAFRSWLLLFVFFVGLRRCRRADQSRLAIDAEQRLQHPRAGGWRSSTRWSGRRAAPATNPSLRSSARCCETVESRMPRTRPVRRPIARHRSAGRGSAAGAGWPAPSASRSPIRCRLLHRLGVYFHTCVYTIYVYMVKPKARRGRHAESSGRKCRETGQ